MWPYIQICHINTYTNLYIYPYISVYIHTYSYMYIYTYVYAYIHIYINTYIHIYIYTYIHIYILHKIYITGLTVGRWDADVGCWVQDGVANIEVNTCRFIRKSLARGYTTARPACCAAEYSTAIQIYMYTYTDVYVHCRHM